MLLSSPVPKETIVGRLGHWIIDTLDIHSALT